MEAQEGGITYRWVQGSFGGSGGYVYYLDCGDSFTAVYMSDLTKL